MRRAYAVGLAVSMVALNAAAFVYLRDRMLDTPAAPTGSDPASAPSAGDSAGALADEELLVGKVTLAGGDDGSLLRLTFGACAVEGQPSATAWVAAPGGQPERVTIPGLSRTLAAGSDDDGWWVVGADAGCQVRGWRSDGLEATDWQQGAVPADTWFLDPRDASRVSTSRIHVTLPEGCGATEVHTIDADALVVCRDGRALRIARASREVSEMGPSDLTSVSVRGDGRLATLFADDGCVAGARLLVGEREVEEPHCFGSDKLGLGIAWAGDEPVAQVGFSLFDHADGEWTERS